MYTDYEILEVVRQALSPNNRYYCAEKLGREPTVIELVEHYLRFAPPVVHVVQFDVDDDQFPLFV